MSKILIIGDAGVSSGFGVVTTNIGARLAETHGHEVHVLAARYRGDPHGTSMHLWKADADDPLDTYGKKRVVEVLKKVEPDVVLMLNDPHVLCRLLFANEFDPQQALRRFRPVIAYYTLDGTNLPEAYKVFGRYTRPVAMSRHGQSQIPGSDLVYHGVDTDIFRPASISHPIVTSTGDVITSKADAKRAFGYDPAGFMVLRVDRNGWRKDFGSTWKALVPVVAGHEGVHVHFHCAGNDAAGGPIMPSLFSRDQKTMDRFKLSDRTDWATNDLVALYNAADVFVSNSMGEGFGLTLAEALACGVPVVAQNVSSIPEVVGPGGLLIEPGPVITSPSGQDLRVSDVEKFTGAIELLYRDPELRRSLSAAGVKHVRESFSWDVAASQFNEKIRDIHQASLTQGFDPGETTEATASA
jgi:glycosyltransferase involved in cell wall biosynthesis